jgi:hypothetical protein
MLKSIYAYFSNLRDTPATLSRVNVFLFNCLRFLSAKLSQIIVILITSANYAKFKQTRIYHIILDFEFLYFIFFGVVFVSLVLYYNIK